MILHFSWESASLCILICCHFVQNFYNFSCHFISIAPCSFRPNFFLFRSSNLTDVSLRSFFLFGFASSHCSCCFSLPTTADAGKICSGEIRYSLVSRSASLMLLSQINFLCLERKTHQLILSCLICYSLVFIF